jgi:hypothetical protein
MSNRPSEEFAKFCTAEFERRRNSGEGFDESAYEQAMQLALKKLRLLEEERPA